MITLDYATTTTPSAPFDIAPAAHRPDVSLVQLHDALWRVTRHGGEVLGYIEQFTERDADRFRAKRLIASTTRFLPMGEFWRMDDAIDCFCGG